MFGHNNFDYALQAVFMGEVTKTKPVKWTDGDWGDGQDPNWATDTRSWTYNGYAITQESKSNPYCIYDARCDNTRYEIKCRRCKFETYSSTIVPYSKKKAYIAGNRLLFVFCFVF